jgi:hypothetical protein
VYIILIYQYKFCFGFQARATLNQRSVVGEHTLYPPCEIEYGRMHLPNSASGTFDRGEFMPKVHIDPDHLVDINQSEITESLMIDSTKNTAEDSTVSFHPLLFSHIYGVGGRQSAT